MHAQGNTERGRVLADKHVCVTCHTAEDPKVLYIDGQKIYYLNRQIEGFRRPQPQVPVGPLKVNARHHQIMQQQALTLSAQDIRDIAEYLAAQPCAPVRPPKAVAAAEPAKLQRCVYCHGVTGINPYDVVPNIAGQKRQYLIDELMKFRESALDRPREPDQERFHRLMASATYDLTDGEIVQFADYYSAQSCRIFRF